MILPLPQSYLKLIVAASNSALLVLVVATGRDIHFVTIPDRRAKKKTRRTV